MVTVHTHRGSTTFTLQPTSDGLISFSGHEWQQFVAKNNINETYMLIFLHRGNMHFTVTVFNQTAVCIESDEDDDDNEDSSEVNEESNYVIDVGEYGAHTSDDDVEIIKMVLVTVPPSSGCNYRHARLARLTIPTRPLMAYNLLDFNMAILKVPTVGTLTWPAHLKWISGYDRSGGIG
ncbi:hypothetical protein BUALT_Bualt07G0051700 [Buddleja alternifolia]|uniref:TF-B3 domain-containing protein n=1 Tax=Buddleja alternifolia TaxID=168488 RepID=A0AAV6XF33_9LAMI|nr:hypothetical protein BUALT_Bualt07G0051700 [Buddleja alternifolia]